MGKSIDIAVAFGMVLRRLRLGKKLTQEQLGFESGLRRTFISSLELGEKLPSIKTIEQLSIALDIPMSKLFQLIESEQKK